ncbi:tyrosine-type recombinase/integrase [Hymenobacter sp.]|jgi:integrase|uniref:tyrosine-type recombinase/integrase n=1 Tax=Hymenobacter sp. TaxID=1898978 RepID=UPI002EDB21DB
MTTQFVLRTDKKDSAGRCPVHLVVYLDGTRLKCATGEKCKPAEWNADRQQFRRSFTGADEANQYLTLRIEQVNDWWRKLRAVGETPTVEGLRKALAPPSDEVAVPERQQSLVALMDDFRTVLRGRGYMYETLRHYLVVRNWLASYEKRRGQPLLVATYDLAAHDGFLAFMTMERKLSANSVYTAVKDLKALLNFLRDERSYTLGVEVKNLKANSVDVDKVYLTAAELEALRVAVLPANLGPVRDVFLFCCYTGLRYSDALQLHVGNVDNWDGGRVLRLTQSKTRKRVSIYLTSAAAAIIDKYADGQRTRLLPMLTNQVMNRYLKRVLRLAGVASIIEVVRVVAGSVVKTPTPKHDLVTMHTARHTFATQSLLRGMPVAVLQKILGHTNIKTTLVYAKIVEDFQHQTMRRVWEAQDAISDTTDIQSSQICAVEHVAA